MCREHRFPSVRVFPAEDWVRAVDSLPSYCNQASLTRGAHLPKSVIPLSPKQLPTQPRRTDLVLDDNAPPCPALLWSMAIRKTKFL